MNSWSSKKPSLVTARACVLIFQAFQLFSSSVPFYDRSRLPCSCRPESHKRNTCEPASAFCSPCRSILPCRQVRQVTNIYVLSFCVSSLSSFCILSNSSISVLLGASLRQFLSREAVAAGIAKVVVQVIFTPISNISSNAIMVDSSLPVSFINPV